MISTARNYSQTLKEIRSIVEGEPDLVANLSNIAALLKKLDGYFWVGFYIVKGEELVLGPFQGPVACTRIAKGRGVCGTAWAENRTVVVSDVHEFPGHIACSAFSQSEVVVPIHNDSGKVSMVLDVDSDKLNAFSAEDAEALEEVACIVSTFISPTN